MRRALDTIYSAALWVSAACLAGIALLVGIQLVFRLVDGLLKLIGAPVLGFQILSLAEIAGYTLAGASFMALAPTLKAGAHIRVTMLVSALPGTARRWVESAAFAFSTAVCAYGAWHLINFAWVSYRFNEVSYGVIRVPLFIPQAVMALGAIVLAVALLDETVTVVRNGRASFQHAEDSISLGKE